MVFYCGLCIFMGNMVTMKEIPLSQDKVALVDDDMYDYLSKWKWCYHKGYAARNELFITASGEKARKLVRMHRVIMNAPDGMDVDHRWGDTLDNRKENLRICTRQQNSCNKAQVNNTSGFKGVSWHKARNKWRAQIKLNQRQIHLGYFNNKTEAAKAYNAAALQYQGEFALLNQIPA